VRIVILRAWARLTVFDLGHLTNTPTLQATSPDSDHGHGLQLVAALAQDWGIGGDARGFTVWADIPGYLINDPTTTSTPAALMTTNTTAARTELAARVRARRGQLGLSQHDLATRAAQHWSAIDRIERGQSNPSLSMLLTLAAALETTLSDLLKDITLADNNKPS
jgi:DNA-binding XRE family transcriptional regulator